MTDEEAVTRAEYLAGVVDAASKCTQASIQEAISNETYRIKAVHHRLDIERWNALSKSVSAEIRKEGYDLFSATVRLRLARKIESMEGELARVREITVG